MDPQGLSPIGTPKTLLEIASYQVALCLVDLSLPTIIRCFSEFKIDVSYGNSSTSSGNSISNVACLNRLKLWYWDQENKHFGSFTSSQRIFISRALIDIFDIEERHVHCPILLRFCLQLLFGFEVGDFNPSTEEVISQEVSEEFSRFLLEIAPFYVQSLRDLTLVFRNPLPMAILISKSKFLKYVHMFKNISDYTLHCVRTHCKELRSITLDIEYLDESPRNILDETLYRIFFKNTMLSTVVRKTYAGEKTEVSFASLKLVWIKCDHLVQNLARFIECLQFNYLETSIKVTNLISVPYGGCSLRIPCLFPTFLLENLNISNERYWMYLGNDVTTIDPKDCRGSSERYSHSLAFQIFSGRGNHFQDIATLFQLFNLLFIYSDGKELSMSSHFPETEVPPYYLSVYGPITNELIECRLLSYLSRCRHLKSLYIITKPLHPPCLGMSLNLDNLQTLSIRFIYEWLTDGPREETCMYKPLEEKNVERFMLSLLRACPNLRVLEIDVREFMIYLVPNGYLRNIHTLSVLGGSLPNIEACIINMPKLKVVKLPMDFDYGQFLYLKRQFFNSSIKISFKYVRYISPYIA
ncbi:uncharacterized protein [Palaemon carinicauda]|uniref:uncharacterized protein n=1 Tax=Palaemon carinicauda TaxID=392227 RepID=UPI0035B61235